MSHKKAYVALTDVFTRLYRYQHLAAMAGWDQHTMMPGRGSEARTAAMAELGVLMHRTQTDPALQGWLAEAEQEDLSDMERASLREMRRQWQHANLLPEKLVEAKTLAGMRCEHAWREQRQANDWTGFLANFREVVRLSREEGALLAAHTGGSPYDALMNKYEPGMQSAEIEGIFSDVKTWLPGLIAQVRERQAGESVLQPQGPFSTVAQRALGLEVMRRIGFEFDAGRLDISVHPFCGGVAEDVRITTRYSEDDFTQSLMGIIHETGHARYEQNLPRDWVHLPVGQARSMGIHESQSLSFEMQLGRHPGFLHNIAPLVRQHLSADPAASDPAFDPANLARFYSRVEPGFIRVDADELCYPAHVILRFEIERALMNSEIEAEDIPALWGEKMQAYLGIDTRGNYKNGCLQDMHWSDGSFGYFPSYTLGAMYAAQYFASMRQIYPTLDEEISIGDFRHVFAWLNEHIWSQASRWETGELVRRATGESLNPGYFRAHLEARYLA